MTYEENREFSADLHGMVKPLSERYVGVVLDYWQIFEGEGSTKPGRFLRRYGFKGIDTSGQVILSPSGELLAAHRSWKTGNGFTARELRDFAARYPAKVQANERLRLGWFMIDRDYFRVDLGGPEKDLSRYCSPSGALQGARKMRRPLVRVDGPALAMLEEHQEFLRRHLRQFWWQKGDPTAPARLVVLNSHDTPPDAKPTELTGSCAPGRVPVVMAALDLRGGVDLAKISPVLDECWRQYMANRPSNADNLTFRKEEISRFKVVDATIRQLAREGRLLVPGGRRLLGRRPDRGAGTNDFNGRRSGPRTARSGQKHSF